MVHSEVQETYDLIDNILWVLRFPLAYILSKHTALAETEIWISFPVANAIAVIITIAWFMQGS